MTTNHHLTLLKEFQSLIRDVQETLKDIHDNIDGDIYEKVEKLEFLKGKLLTLGLKSG